MSCGLFCVPGTIACQTLDFSFGSGVTWPRQRDGRRLFRHAAPGCFPVSSGIACQHPSSKCLWCSVHRFLCLEQWSSVPQQWNSCQNLDFFIPFTSGVWRQRDGRRLFRHAVPGCFPDSKGVLWLGLCAWNNCLPDP